MAATFVVAERMIRKQNLAGLPANDPDSVRQTGIASAIAARLDSQARGVILVAAFPGRKEEIRFNSVLLGIEVVITSAKSVENFMRAAFNNVPRLHDQN